MKLELQTLQSAFSSGKCCHTVNYTQACFLNFMNMKSGTSPLAVLLLHFRRFIPEEFFFPLWHFSKPTDEPLFHSSDCVLWSCELLAHSLGGCDEDKDELCDGGAALLTEESQQEVMMIMMMQISFRMNNCYEDFLYHWERKLFYSLLKMMMEVVQDVFSCIFNNLLLLLTTCYSLHVLLELKSPISLNRAAIVHFLSLLHTPTSLTLPENNRLFKLTIPSGRILMQVYVKIWKVQLLSEIFLCCCI